ncbi:hypothetical protein DFP81_1112 [Marinomonas pollencensis]|uniref:Uncharacterized protein n=1 Tax=Marinomonas pollencensis TaxID=491954 RepID=A0A3E0DGR7_9GAMM|nr:hypothetical protein DFP81_1112 [Marinomonas pollencensis]
MPFFLLWKDYCLRGILENATKFEEKYFLEMLW